MSDEIIVRELIDKETFLKLLNEYYSIKLRKYVSIEDRPSIKNVDGISQIDISLVYEEYAYGERIPNFLNIEDINEVLEIYANNRGLIFDKFEYVGDIRRIGYFTDEDTPIFEGVYIYYKEKEHNLIKRLINKMETH